MAEAANAKAKDSIERTKALKRIAHHSIMSVDFTGLSDVAKEYYQLEQRRILSETYEEACQDMDRARTSEELSDAASAAHDSSGGDIETTNEPVEVSNGNYGSCEEPEDYE